MAFSHQILFEDVLTQTVNFFFVNLSQKKPTVSLHAIQFSYEHVEILSESWIILCVLFVFYIRIYDFRLMKLINFLLYLQDSVLLHLDII